MSTDSQAKCHACGEETDPDFICRSCDQVVCEKCMTPFTIHNQIDFCQCQDCTETSDSLRYLETCKEEEYEDRKKAIKDKRNALARERYRSPEQVEKRRLEKVEQLKKEMEYRKKRAERIGDIMKSFRF